MQRWSHILPPKATTCCSTQPPSPVVHLGIACYSFIKATEAAITVEHNWCSSMVQGQASVPAHSPTHPHPQEQHPSPPDTQWYYHHTGAPTHSPANRPHRGGARAVLREATPHKPWPGQPTNQPTNQPTRVTNRVHARATCHQSRQSPRHSLHAEHLVCMPRWLMRTCRAYFAAAWAVDTSVS
jgi:hypothetical protein